MAALTPKQQRFVEEYLVDLNGTQAAIRAGYSAKTAQEQSSRLLSKAIIQNAVSERQKKISEKIEVTVERVVREYARVAFLDPRKIFTGDGGLKPIQEIDDETVAAIAGVESADLYEGYGDERERVGTLRKVKLADKVRALDSLAKHLGMFVDKVEHSGSVEALPVRVVIERSTQKKPS